MKNILTVPLFLSIFLLSACAGMDPHPMDMSQAIQDAKSKADHLALAQHFEDAAKEMQLKVDEHKKLLSKYESHSYLYGKQAQNLKSHCRRLVTVYEGAVEANLNMAKAHREM